MKPVRPESNRSPRVRLLSVRRSRSADPDAEELEVDCPLIEKRAVLRTCVECVHGQGLLLDPGSSTLTLRCAHPHERGDDSAQV